MGTLQHVQHQISAVNDLIRINNDRVTGYKRALEDISQPQCQELFQKFLQQSQHHIAELQELIHLFGGEAASGTTMSGKFYRTWLDLKTKFGGNGILSVLDNCEHGEEVTENAYREAIDDKELIWQDKRVETLLDNHLNTLIAAHAQIREFRQHKV